MGNAAQVSLDGGLGSPTPQPDGLMVFDGTCRLCARSVQAVLRMDRDGVVQFVPAQSDYGRVLCNQAGVDPDDPSTFLFFDRGSARPASDGVLAILRRMPLPWRRLAALSVIPRPLRDRAYYLVARNRYRIFGRSSCELAPPEVRARLREHVPPDAA